MSCFALATSTRKSKQSSVSESESGGGMEDVSLNDVNNLVVSLRPKVAQAKVHLVRHLVRQAAKLDKRKSGGDREKCARKAQRMRAEVAFINKMERDEVAKFAIGSAVTLEVRLCSCRSRQHS